MSVETETAPSETPEKQPESLIQTEASEPAEQKEEPPEEKEPAPAEEFTPLSADDISIPEDLEVSEEFRDEFLGVLNDQEMSPKDRAQALINLQQKVMTQGAEALTRQFDDQQKAWQDEVKSDTKLGGGNFQTHLSKMGKLVEQYGSDDLVQVFAATGAGNNIHVHRFLAKMADVLLEGTPAQGNPTSAEGDRASRMFPSMKG